MKKWILLFVLLPTILFGQTLNFSVGKTSGRGSHFIGIDFYNGYYESTLDYLLMGSKLNINVDIELCRFLFDYKFEHGEYSGYMWDNDYEINILMNKIKAWNETYSDIHMVRFGYLVKDDIVQIGLFISQYWSTMEHNMRNGQIFISNCWPVDKYIYGLDSYYTERSNCYGVGIDINFWMLQTEFNYFHRIKTRGQGWWNLRDMVFNVYNYSDYYKGDVRFVCPLGRFFSVYFNYGIDVFHLIGVGFKDNRTYIHGMRAEESGTLNKNTRFFHAVGVGIELNLRK